MKHKIVYFALFINAPCGLLSWQRLFYLNLDEQIEDDERLCRPLFNRAAYQKRNNPC